MKRSELLATFESVISGSIKNNDDSTIDEDIEIEEDEVNEDKTPEDKDEENKELRELSDDELNRILDKLDERTSSKTKENEIIEKMTDDEKKIYDINKRETALLKKAFDIELKSVCSDLQVDKDVAANFIQFNKYKDSDDLNKSLLEDLTVLKEYIDKVTSEKIKEVEKEKDAKYIELAKRISKNKLSGKEPFIKKDTDINTKPKTLLEALKID